MGLLSLNDLVVDGTLNTTNRLTLVLEQICCGLSSVIDDKTHLRRDLVSKSVVLKCILRLSLNSHQMHIRSFYFYLNVIINF